jgi:hypothetical protein
LKKLSLISSAASPANPNLQYYGTPKTQAIFFFPMWPDAPASYRANISNITHIPTFIREKSFASFFASLIVSQIGNKYIPLPKRKD